MNSFALFIFIRGRIFICERVILISEVRRGRANEKLKWKKYLSYGLLW
jgi:hypothetical protein